MTKLEKAELINHYTWLVSTAKKTSKFSEIVKKRNNQIWEILLNLKTKEASNE